MNFNFENISDVTTFDELKKALQSNFNELLSKGYLYKGDMGETPQIVNRPLVEKVDDEGNVIEWSALGKSIIGAIFKDTKYYAARGMFDINALTADGKLNGLNGATYPWWCADGNPDYPIYPATYFVYIDSTPNDIRNKDKDWEDNSCILIPADVEYSDYRDDAPEEELEPTVTYHKNHIYPSFYFDSEAASAGAWCWKINDVETGIPASVANDDGSVLGHMFIFKNEDGVYKYKAGVDAEDKWMTRQEMMNSELRYPINGDIGFTIEKVKETGGDSTTITSINTLQIYNFVEDDKDSVNGGAWGLGGNLISFGESFYKALWKFISSDSGVEINNGKIILGTTSGNHCIFVKKNGEDGNQTLILIPYQGDPSEKTDFADDDIWKEAKLQINYPETKFVNDVSINGNLNTSIITSKSINNDGDISCKSINASGDISTESSISCNEISANNFTVNDNSVIIGSDDQNMIVNIASPNFNITNDYIGTKLPFISNNIIKVSETKNPKEYIKISNTHVLTEQTQLTQSAAETNSTTETIISGGEPIPGSNVSGSYDGSGVDAKTVTVKYESEKYELHENIVGITLSMPRSLGISIKVIGGVSYGSWPLLTGGKMTLRLFATKNDGGSDIELCTPQPATITRNSSSDFSGSRDTKWCTIYCSFTSDQLNTASSNLLKGKNIYKKIYITAEAIFNLGVDKGTLGGYHKAIYEAGKTCKLYSCNLNPSGGSIWTSGAPANYSSGIFKVSTTKLKKVDSDNGITTVSICPDGILIGKASNNSAVLYVNDDGFHIEYHIPKVGDKNTRTETIKVLSISTAGGCESDVFQLKQPTTTSSTTT